jgi:Tfp pilus assembly protein PilF
MTLDGIFRHRVPIAIGSVLLALWVAAGIRHVDTGAGRTIRDSPLGILAPVAVDPGWHFAPPGFVRLSTYPTTAATYTFGFGDDDATALVTREGVGLRAGGTIRYRVEPERILETHAAVGAGFGDRLLPGWVLADVRAAVRESGYSDISGARTEALRESLARTLTERFRPIGVILLSCDISSVQIAVAAGPGGSTAAVRSRVVLLGMDGLDWNVLNPMIEAGNLPHIARLARGGVRGKIRSITPMLSPVIWTSVATGVLPARHGIIDFLATTAREGEKVPVTSTLRKTRALWNILSDGGVSVGIVGWWATYPAETVRGYVVSDRVAYQLFGAHQAREQARDGRVYPPDLDPLVTSLTIAPETIPASTVQRYVRLPEDPAALPEAHARMIEELKTLVAAGDTYTAIALALGEKYRPDFQAIYIESTDTVAHLFMRYVPPPLPGVPPEDVQRFGRAVEAYYRHADELVGRIVDAAGPGAAVILCSDHGFRTGGNRPLTDPRIGYGQAADWHRKHGVVILHGPPFRRGVEIEEASVLDITPTVLTAFGLPAAEEMDGRPILEAFDPEFLRRHPVTWIRTYEGGAIVAQAPPAAPVPADPRGDSELKEKLESLGYLRQNTANSHNNRGMILLQEGKFDEAIAEFRTAIAGSEDLAIAQINIARAQFKKRDYDAATATLAEHLARQPRSKEAENLLGNIAMERGRMAEAEAHLRKALSYEPNFTDARNTLGILHDRLGRTEDALREFRRVVEVDPDYAEALNNIGIIEKKQGRIREATESFRRAISADPEFAGSYSNLALILEQNGDRKGAEDQYRRALEHDPRNAAVRTNYGGLLYTLGRYVEARAQLEQAVAIDPDYASAHNNLGAVYGRLQRDADELASYRKAVAIDPDYADVRHNLGLALIRQGSPVEGEKELREAVRIEPGYAPAHLALGRSILDRGDHGEAVAVLENAAGRLPRHAEIVALLGEARARAGDRAGAIEALERSLAIRPDQPAVRQRLDGLKAAP